MLKSVLLVGVTLLSALQGQQTPPPVQTPVQTPTPAPTPTISFAEFIAGIRADALKAGIRKETLDAALNGIEPNPVVVARDRAQPEASQSLDDYLAARLTPARIETGKTMATTHAALLGRVEETYGLPVPMMVAFWGLESNFGGFTGTYQTISSLATLAYDG